MKFKISEYIRLVKSNIIDFVRQTDRKLIALSLLVMFLILPHISPVVNVKLTVFDRTFCPASMVGLSISQRIINMYISLFIIAPFLFLLLLFVFKKVNVIKEIFLRNSKIYRLTVVRKASDFILPCYNKIRKVFSSMKKTINTKNCFTALFFALVATYFCLGVVNFRYLFRLIHLERFIQTETASKNLCIYFPTVIMLPAYFYLFTSVLSRLMKGNDHYSKILNSLSAFVIFAVCVSYREKCFAGDLFLTTLLLYLVLVCVLAFIDSDNKLTLSDFAFMLLGNLLCVACGSIFLTPHSVILWLYLIIVTLFFGLVTVLISKYDLMYRCRQLFYNLLALVMWGPAIFRVLLEILYFANEKKYVLQNGYMLLINCFVAVLCVFFLMVFMAFFRRIDLKNFGYLGTIVSLCAWKFFFAGYQYVVNCGNYANIYEWGNGAVAMDSILWGKLPIIDYFSAHALGDVWTKILYCFVHSDIKGIFADPYGGLATLMGTVILFFILKNLFSAELSVFFVCLFPYRTCGFKITSICFLGFYMLVKLIKKYSVSRLFAYWFSLILIAFYTYDEGIYIGLATVITYLLLAVLDKNWRKTTGFIITGAISGAFFLSLVAMYSSIHGFSFTDRVKEWISVTANSSCVWATVIFGNLSSMAGIVSYFVVPFFALIAVTFLVAKYRQDKRDKELVALAVSFAIAQLLYIPRTIIYHNLYVCEGWTGVLLNFTAWTVAMFFIVFKANHKCKEKKFIAFCIAMFMVIVLVGRCVVGHHRLPTAFTPLYSGALSKTLSVNIKEQTQNMVGQERIVYNEATQNFISQFRNVFDLLLKPNETFLDFANITSLYAMTGRVRPCYVGQMPSLLTDLYSQKCFFEEISRHDIPLTIVGTTEEAYTAQMIGIPHNVRYYKIAEYLYRHYRPLVRVGEFCMWCDKNRYNEFKTILISKGLETLDYGYDSLIENIDDKGNIQIAYHPFHQYNLQLIPYMWANMDKYNAKDGEVIFNINSKNGNDFVFIGSQYTDTSNGNYLLFECCNKDVNEKVGTFNFSASKDKKIAFEYSFTVLPGNHAYLIRVSQDYFWQAFNIDTIKFTGEDSLSISKLQILQGD